MSRTFGGILIVALAWPALAAEEKAKGKPATPAEQYQALVKEFQDAQQAFFKDYQAAKTQEEKQNLFKEKYPQPAKFAPKFLELAEKHPRDRAAFDALAWVANNTSSTPAAKDTTRAKAIEILLRDHLQNPQLGQVCQNLAYGNDPQSETFLRAVLAKSPHQDVQAEACLSLARRLGDRATTAGLLKKNPDVLKQYEGAFGKEYVAALLKEDSAKIEAESKQLSRQFADKYLGQMKPERLKAVCQRLSYVTDKGSEAILRAILEKSAERDVQGPACLYLAQLLRRRADSQHGSDAAEVAKVRRESEALLERAKEKYADVKLEFYGTIGKKAESELFELHHLSVGKVAPEIEGQDQDGKDFKLSDYRGKVVMLDFWSQY